MSITAQDKAIQNEITIRAIEIGVYVKQLLDTRQIKAASVDAMLQQVQTGVLAGVALLMNLPRKDGQ